MWGQLLQRQGKLSILFPQILAHIAVLSTMSNLSANHHISISFGVLKGLSDLSCKMLPFVLKGTAPAIDPNSCFEVQLLSFMGLSICGDIPGL